MKFLFRTPLFDFDPDNESEIQQNWAQILEAISAASPSLFYEIHGLNYAQLGKAIKLKVKKYILRGRYRSTPFGKFAAVGLGKIQEQKFSLDLQKTVELKAKSICENHDFEQVEWHLSLGGYHHFDRNIFLSYQVSEERWALVGIPSNLVFNRLLSHFKSFKKIQFSDFQSWFKDEDQNSIIELWTHLIELGILYSNEESLKLKIAPSSYSDLFMADSLGIDKEVNGAIEDFFETAGQLFVPMYSSHLERLKKWFHVKFDDRFVPLPLLITYPEFTSSDFFEMKPNGELQRDVIEIPSASWGVEEVDLKKIVTEAQLDSNIYSLDLVVKALNDGRIVIENALCNRPFALIGRFNKQEEIFDFAREIKEKVYVVPDLIYAELRIFENHITQGICETRSIFDTYISPFYQDDPNCIPLEEIEIGLRDDEFVLVYNKSGKRIIPIVTHPLNGKQISHPLMRLLWELDHQQSFKLAHYQSPEFISRPYSPRLTWGKTIIQPRRWVVNLSQFEKEDVLRNWLKNHFLPFELTVGVYDRELLIDWQSHEGFEILWSELRKHPKCVLSEVLWKDKSPYTSSKGNVIYPQLILSHRKVIEAKPWRGFLNSICHESSEWLYFIFWVEEEDLEDSMLVLFSFDFIEYLRKNHIRWYYLVYPELDQLQVRIRFLPKSNDQKREILSSIIHQLGHQLRIEQRPYYPEVRKYGEKTYQISEELFWMESNLMAEKIWTNLYLGEPCEISIQSLKQFWMELISEARIETYCFKKIKDKVKGMSIELKRSFAASSDPVLIQKVLPIEWKKVYRLRLYSHLEHWSEDQMKWQVISNHLHMQVNRFYSVKRKRMEDLLYYLLYKDLGKRMFGNGGS